MMKELVKIFVAIIVVSIVSFLLYFAKYPLVSGIIVACIAFFAGVGVWEYKQFVKRKNFSISPEIPIICSIVFIASVYLSRFFSQAHIYPLIVLALSLFFLFLFHFKEIENAILKIATSFFGICYVAVPLGMMLSILFPSKAMAASFDGRLWIVYLIAVTKITDVGAYFTGKIIQGRKLAPTISPGKTMSGLIGGLVFALLCSLIFYQLSRSISGFQITLLQSIVFGLVLGVIGQIGDLAESLLKRDAKIKDSNKLPGMGGVLDMLDSLLFTAPIIYFFLLTRVV